MSSFVGPCPDRTSAPRFDDEVTHYQILRHLFTINRQYVRVCTRTVFVSASGGGKLVSGQTTYSYVPWTVRGEPGELSTVTR